VKNTKKTLTSGGDYDKISANNTLIEWVLKDIGAEDDFTGQINVEINVVDGEVKDFKIGHMRRVIV